VNIDELENGKLNILESNHLTYQDSSTKSCKENIINRNKNHPFKTNELNDSDEMEGLDFKLSPKFGDTLVKNPLRLTKSLAVSEQTISDLEGNKYTDSNYYKSSSLFPHKPIEDIVL
jgi:hypothetical protein